MLHRLLFTRARASFPVHSRLKNLTAHAVTVPCVAHTCTHAGEAGACVCVGEGVCGGCYGKKLGMCMPGLGMHTNHVLL